MKIYLVRRFAFVLMLLLCAGMSVAQDNDKQCTNQDINGGYGFQITGVNLRVGFFALVGKFTADGNGAFEVTGTESIAGRIEDLVLEGTYVVNPDCTGTAVARLSDGPSINLSFILVDDGREIMILDSDAGVVESGSAKKQFVHKKD